MATSVSISELTALGAAPASGDLLVLVDISDPTQSPQGTTVNLTVAELFTTVTIDTSLTVNGSTSLVNALSPPLSVTGETVLTSASANALTVGRLGATTPAFQIDASTASQVAGLKLTGAGTGGTVALATIDSGGNNNLTINAKGTGTIGIGTVSSGLITIGQSGTGGVVMNCGTSGVNVQGTAASVNFRVLDNAGTGDRLRVLTNAAGNGVDFQSMNAAEGAFAPMTITSSTLGITTTLTLTGDSSLLGTVQLGRTGNADVITIGGSGYGAGVASVRFNGLTSGGTGNTPSLSQGPVTGNPNFWIPVSIAGTLRYIPAW